MDEATRQALVQLHAALYEFIERIPEADVDREVLLAVGELSDLIEPIVEQSALMSWVETQ
jgi:hypothetical protein